MSHQCGICRPGITTLICKACLDTHPLTTAEGHLIEFKNTTPWCTGFASFIEGRMRQPAVHSCYLDGVPCHASERKMGGIDIEVHSSWHDMHRLRLLRQQRARARFTGKSTACAATPTVAAGHNGNGRGADCENVQEPHLAAHVQRAYQCSRAAVALRHLAVRHCFAGAVCLALAEAH